MQRYRLLKSSARRGFSLIEAAIVLGIIGLVLGSIWVAAAQVRRHRVINEAVMFIKQTAMNFQNKFDLTTYPASGITYPTYTAYVAKVFPPGTTYNSVEDVVQTRDGTSFQILQSTDRFAVYLQFLGNNASTLPTSYCKEILVRFGQVITSSDRFSYFQTTHPPLIQYAPIRPSSVQCNANNQRVQFYFLP